MAPYLQQLDNPNQDWDVVLKKNNEDKRLIYEHIYASLEERDEILGRNPWRFYPHGNACIGQNAERLQLLNKCLEVALALEKYELCERIMEVKEKLADIYST